MLQTVPGVLLLCFLVVIAYGYAAGKIGRGLLLVSLIAAFPLVYQLSKNVGWKESERVRSHPEAIVKFQFKGPEVKPQGVGSTTDADDVSKDELVRRGDAEQLHLLVETKDRIVVYYQPKSSFTAVNPAIKVYTILRSELNWSVVISG